jgi:hypothetical protein
VAQLDRLVLIQMSLDHKAQLALVDKLVQLVQLVHSLKFQDLLVQQVQLESLLLLQFNQILKIL